MPPTNKISNPKVKITERPEDHKIIKSDKKGSGRLFMDVPVFDSEQMARITLEKYHSHHQVTKRQKEKAYIKRKASEDQAAEMLRKYAPRMRNK